MADRIASAVTDSVVSWWAFIQRMREQRLTYDYADWGWRFPPPSLEGRPHGMGGFGGGRKESSGKSLRLVCGGGSVFCMARIAQRFSAGNKASHAIKVPKGRKNRLPRASAGALRAASGQAISLRSVLSSLAGLCSYRTANPALKRWAILKAALSANRIGRVFCGPLLPNVIG